MKINPLAWVNYLRNETKPRNPNAWVEYLNNGHEKEHKEEKPRDDNFVSEMGRWVNWGHARSSV